VAVISAVVAFGLGVVARPLKIDYHASICQKTNNGPAVTYRTDGISVPGGSGGTTSVVCPLEQVTFTSDTVATATITFKAWVQAKDTSGEDSYCALISGGTTFASIPSFPIALGVVNGNVLGTGVFPVPTATDSNPTEIHVACDFDGAAFLGTMQVKMVDHP
jgi:hypothetical protein